MVIIFIFGCRGDDRRVEFIIPVTKEFRVLFKFVQPTPLLESTRSDSDRVGIFLSLERWINSRSISCDVCYFTVLRKKYLKKEKRNIFPLIIRLEIL